MFAKLKKKVLEDGANGESLLPQGFSPGKLLTHLLHLTNVILLCLIEKLGWISRRDSPSRENDGNVSDTSSAKSEDNAITSKEDLLKLLMKRTNQARRYEAKFHGQTLNYYCIFTQCVFTRTCQYGAR